MTSPSNLGVAKKIMSRIARLRPAYLNDVSYWALRIPRPVGCRDMAMIAFALTEGNNN